MKRISCALALLAATAVQAAPMQWASNGHWYEVVANKAATGAVADVGWLAANAAAGAATHEGQAGYLATVTSAEENAFITSLFGNAYHWAWLGGSDAGSGTWHWVGGPEAGQAFTYTSWAASEPNDYFNEQYLLTNWSAPGLWNDVAPLGSDSYPGVAYYVVEYGGTNGGGTVPEPGTLLLTGGMLAGLAWSRRRTR